MVAVEPLAQAAQLAAPLTGAELPMPSLLLGEGIFDVLAGIAGSPIILLVPIGAGTLVALGIIWVLVKSRPIVPTQIHWMRWAVLSH